jgi:hypothetical protein
MAPVGDRTRNTFSFHFPHWNVSDVPLNSLEGLKHMHNQERPLLGWYAPACEVKIDPLPPFNNFEGWKINWVVRENICTFLVCF